MALGNFDGVHLGHRVLLERARRRADARGGEAVVLTFDPHPAKVLARTHAPPLITTPARKLELLAAERIDVCVVEPFTPELAARPGDEFIDAVLVERLGAREVVVGWNFTYGHRRDGDVETLRRAGARRGFEVDVVEPVEREGAALSSTAIRARVQAGDVEGAARLLGRAFEVEGPTIAGAGRGRAIGVPTANIAPETELLPRTGVYAAHVEILDGPRPARHPAVVSLGTNPTFTDANRLSLEAHLLDFQGDLYGRRLRVVFHSWLRGEVRFPSVEALVARIREDIEVARERLCGSGT